MSVCSAAAATVHPQQEKRLQSPPSCSSPVQIPWTWHETGQPSRMITFILLFHLRVGWMMYNKRFYSVFNSFCGSLLGTWLWDLVFKVQVAIVWDWWLCQLQPRVERFYGEPPKERLLPGKFLSWLLDKWPKLFTLNSLLPLEIVLFLMTLWSNTGGTGGFGSLQWTGKICRKLLQTVCCLKIQVRLMAGCGFYCSVSVWDIQALLEMFSSCSLLRASSPGEEVLKLLHSCSPFNLEELKKQESRLPPEDSE